MANKKRRLKPAAYAVINTAVFAVCAFTFYQVGKHQVIILYSIISTAQANGLDAEKYLTELFSQPPGTILLPWKD